MSLEISEVCAADAMFDHVWRTLPNAEGLSRWMSQDRMGCYVVLVIGSEGQPVPLAMFSYQTKQPDGKRRRPYFSVFSFKHGYWGALDAIELDEFKAEKVQKVLDDLKKL